jgi:hypothetical protein
VFFNDLIDNQQKVPEAYNSSSSLLAKQFKNAFHKINPACLIQTRCSQAACLHFQTSQP